MKRDSYTGFQILLHWLVALLILFNYLYSEGMGRALDARLEDQVAGPLDINPQIHVWIGVAVLALVILRLIVRRVSGSPPAAGSGQMQAVATWGHRALYLLVLLVPLLGAITWFGKFDGTGELHELIANVLMIAAGVHALIALWHQFFVKDGLLTRMIVPGSK